MGFNVYGQLGDGTLIDKYQPNKVYMDDVLLNKNIIQIALGDSHSLLLSSDSNIFIFFILN
jgi:alpha-tubulin suppressor-like RCC1 family protein